MEEPGVRSLFSGVLQVAVVKVKSSDKVFAMKILNKWEMLKRAEVQTLLSLSISKWISLVRKA